MCSEAYQTAMHTLDQYRGTVVACRYCPPPPLAASDKLDVLKSTVVNALAKVVLDHPHLHVGIRGEETKNPAFVRLDQLDLRNHFEWRACNDANQLEKEYLDITQVQLDSRFDRIDIRPGWRLVVLHSSKTNTLDVLYVWNHPHHDGMSGKIFHRHLLRTLNNTTSQEQDLIDVTQHNWVLGIPYEADKLPPNGEILCKWPLDYTFLAKWFYNEFKPISWFPNSPHATWAPVKCTPYATRFRSFTISATTVANLVQKCRVHDTTITGLMHGLVLVSLSSSLELPSNKGFAIRTPYDLRHFLPSRPPNYPWLDPKETICNYDSVLDREFEPSLVSAIRAKMAGTDTEEDRLHRLPQDVLQIVWDVAARIRADLVARLAEGTRNDLLAVMGYCPDWNSEQKRQETKLRYLSWLVTNLGILDGKPNGEEGWSIDRAELALSAETPSAAFSVSVMTVKDERMVVNISWQDGVIEERVAERLIGDLEEWLNELGRAK